MDSRIISANGVPTSLQVSMFGEIPSGSDFFFSEGNAMKPFLVRCEEDTTLEVVPASSTTGETVEMPFEAGWNPMWVRKIVAPGSGLHFGY